MIPTGHELAHRVLGCSVVRKANSVTAQAVRGLINEIERRQ
jgi:hypothetical protein